MLMRHDICLSELLEIHFSLRRLVVLMRHGAQPDVASPMDNTDIVLTLPDSSFPLAQCIGLEAGEAFGFIARFNVTNVCFKLEDTFHKVLDLVETPLEGSHDAFMHEESPNLDYDDIGLPNPFDHSYVSPICSLPSPSPEYYIGTPIKNSMIFDATIDLGSVDNTFSMSGGNIDMFLSIGYFSGYNASLDTYCLFLVDKPRKITWNTFFDFSFDFLWHLVY